MKTLQAAPALLTGLLVFATPTLAQTAKPLDIAGIAKAIGKEGERSGEMYKVSFPAIGPERQGGRPCNQAGLGPERLGGLLETR